MPNMYIQNPREEIIINIYHKVVETTKIANTQHQRQPRRITTKCSRWSLAICVRWCKNHQNLIISGSSCTIFACKFPLRSPHQKIARTLGSEYATNSSHINIGSTIKKLLPLHNFFIRNSNETYLVCWNAINWYGKSLITFQSNSVIGDIFGHTGWDPSVCQSNRLHIHILRFSCINLGYIL